jgi:hypothetical protein
LKDAGLALTEDDRGGSAPSRTRRGVVDGSTYERFAATWRLEGPLDESGSDTAKEGNGATLDGMNCEAGGESPIVYVSLQVTPCRRAFEHMPS